METDDVELVKVAVDVVVIEFVVATNGCREQMQV